MSRSADVNRVMRSVGQDVLDYRALADLLEEQFQAAMRHQAERLVELSQRISEVVDALERRRAERVAAVEALLGSGARMPTLIAALPVPRAQLLGKGWASLEALVRHCKALNLRNCQLMTDQHDIMRRVLHGEDETYAAA